MVGRGERIGCASEANGLSEIERVYISVWFVLVVCGVLLSGRLDGGLLSVVGWFGGLMYFSRCDAIRSLLVCSWLQ